MHIKDRFQGAPLIRAVFLALIWVFAIPAPGWGEEPAPAKPGKKEDIVRIEEVVVRGEVTSKNLEVTSASILSHEDIVNRVYITPLDIAALAPGIKIDQYKQGGTASNFIMRGFSGNSHGPNTAIFLDGVPLNEGDGYADTNIINPYEIERVEVIKGPASALYGNYASAGVLAFYTKKQVDRNQITLQYGSHNTYEANFVGGFSTEQWDHVYSIQAYHTDGYQDNSDWNKLNAATRITYRLTDDLSVRLSVRGFNSDWDAPGYISQEQFDSDPTKAVSETNGGSKKRISGRIDLDYQLTAHSKALFYFWSYDQEFKRWYANDPAGLAPDAVVGNLRVFDRFLYGTGASYNYLGQFLDRELRFTAGADLLVEDDTRKRWRLLAGTGREKGEMFWDYEIDMKTYSVYAEGGYQVVQPLRVILGARFDAFSGSMKDFLDDGNQFFMENQRIFSPKGGLILTLLQDRLDLFGNYSEGFALLPGFSEQAAFRQDHWDPQKRTQYELGMRARPVPWAMAEIVGFRLKTKKDFIYNSQTDEYENVGKTTRDGIEVKAGFYAFEYGYLQADYAYIDATYDQYEAGGVSFNGKTLQGVPEHIVNLEAGYAPPSGFGGRIRYHWEDGYYTDNANLFSSDSWYRVDAQASYRFGAKTKYMLALDAINLLDKKYADYTSGAANKTYSPALPLSVYLTLSVDF